MGKVLTSAGARALRSPTVLIFLERTRSPKPRDLPGEPTEVSLTSAVCAVKRRAERPFSSEGIQFSPHRGGYLREHSLHGGGTAHQSRVDAVCRDGTGLLNHFRHLRGK